MKHNRIKERQQHRRIAETMIFLCYAFPLKFRYIAIGLLYGVGIIFLRYLRKSDASYEKRMAFIFVMGWGFALRDFRLNYWRCYAGWVSVGVLAGAASYGSITNGSPFTYALLVAGLFILTIHLYKTHLRIQDGDPDPKDPVAVAVEESWQRLQEEKEEAERAEEERIRKIADENARHRR